MKLVVFVIVFVLFFVAACTPSTDQPAETQSVTQTETDQWVTYNGPNGPGTGKHIVLISGDEEYRSEEALPQLARILTDHHGFKTTVLFAQDPEKPGVIDPNYTDNIPGTSQLADADLMLIFTRFRALPDDQMHPIQDFLMAGKPVIGIRTATHAFNFRDSTSSWVHWGNYFDVEDSPWNGGFGRLVLGERWHTHHGHHKHQSTRGVVAPGAEDHPITNGIADGDIWGPTDVYGVRLPMLEGVNPIILGQVINRAGAYDENDAFFGMSESDTEIASVNPATDTPYNPNEPLMPIAWTKPYQLPGGEEGMAFTSTIGSSTDLVNDGARRLLVNAAFYMLDLDVPAEANVALIGEYAPTAYSFHTDEYWDEKGLACLRFSCE